MITSGRSGRLLLAINEVDEVRLLLCGPVYLLHWTLAILPTPPTPIPLLQPKRLRLLDLTEIWPPRLLAAPPGTCQPFTPSMGEHLEGEEGQTRRQGGLLRSIDMVTDRTVGLSDFRGMIRLFSLFTSQIQTPPPQSHTLCMCRYMAVSFSAYISVFTSFCLLFPRAQRSRRLWCMHSWSWQSCSGNVWFTDPLLTYRFDLPFAFQRAGILTVQGLLRCNSACLTTLENHSKYAVSWLTDRLNVCDRQYINLSQKSWFLTTRAMDPHLLTPFVT